MKVCSSKVVQYRICSILLGLVLAGSSASNLARAGDSNTGQGGILDGKAGDDGGTVTITITPENGRPKKFTAKVKPNERSADVMNDLAAQIDADPDLNGSTGSFDLTDSEKHKQATVKTVNIRSINAGFQIRSVTIDPDNSGFKNYDGAIPGAKNEHSYLLTPNGPGGPGLVKFQAIFADAGGITADVDLTFENGTAVSTIMSDLSSQLRQAGVDNVLLGGRLVVDTSPDQTFLIGGFAESSGLRSIAYEQTLTTQATPEPFSALLFSSGLVGLCGALRRRLVRPVIG